MDDLQAGRELDALVAEKVMGWGYVNSGTGWRWRYPDDITGLLYESPPPYSSNIWAAWEVHIRACSWLFSKRRQYLRALQEQARTEDGELVAWPDVLAVLCDRMPEAICFAALEVAKDGMPTPLRVDANQ